ncbi:MAG: zf-TFIIB domain-containing protein [Chthonomonadales bacterium]|nr:zf-TFIIB domain-containing protein [Chthonomonadales bacterium]
MNCPTCTDTPLVIADRLGVEIDYCPRCRGVWLDRGELDKLIERANNSAPPPRYDDRGGPSDRDRRYDQRDRDRYYDDDDERRHRRKRSFLDDIFDF